MHRSRATMPQPTLARLTPRPLISPTAIAFAIRFSWVSYLHHMMLALAQHKRQLPCTHRHGAAGNIACLCDRFCNESALLCSKPSLLCHGSHLCAVMTCCPDAPCTQLGTQPVNKITSQDNEAKRSNNATRHLINFLSFVSSPNLIVEWVSFWLGNSLVVGGHQNADSGAGSM